MSEFSYYQATNEYIIIHQRASVVCAHKKSTLGITAINSPLRLLQKIYKEVVMLH
jgi:hypothetical protein